MEGRGARGRSAGSLELLVQQWAEGNKATVQNKDEGGGGHSAA